MFKRVGVRSEVRTAAGRHAGAARPRRCCHGVDMPELRRLCPLRTGEDEEDCLCGRLEAVGGLGGGGAAVGAGRAGNRTQAGRVGRQSLMMLAMMDPEHWLMLLTLAAKV